MEQAWKNPKGVSPAPAGAEKKRRGWKMSHPRNTPRACSQLSPPREPPCTLPPGQTHTHSVSVLFQMLECKRALAGGLGRGRGDRAEPARGPWGGGERGAA